MRNLPSPATQAILWAILVGIGMLLPGNALRSLTLWMPLSLEAWVDKIEHFVGFGVLTILLARALRRSPRVRKPLAAAAASTFGYGLLLELLQIPHPSRSWEPSDLVADGLGVALGVALVLLSPRRATDHTLA